MQMRDAMKLQRAWQAKGAPPCAHPEMDVEFDLGGRTGDKVCTTCGESFSREELKEMGR
ncbi:hypothetical protein [Streptomyces sp. NPDC058757]|uniref:hypothetical protein n=1 Tax=Streptomyces sp. NPDC058757 TaxID=3346626 RepID=UPI003692C446